MKRLLLCFILLLSTILLFGCSPKKEKPMPEPQIKVMQKSESLNLNVYLDGTYSMAGYVNYPSATVYTDAIKEIERTAASVWKDEKIQYFRFGDELKKLSREQFLAFDKTTFYNQNDTSLQKMVDAIDDSAVSVIITDLFQTNQDIESLLSSLKKKSFADQEKALAVIGFKSQFKGRIYDIGKNRINFDYETGKSNDSYRPFYFLIIGREDDVRTLVLKYQDNFNAGDVKSVIFARNLGLNNYLTQDKNTKSNKEAKEAVMAKINALVKNNQVLQYRLKLDEANSRANLRMNTKYLIGKLPDEYELIVQSIDKWDNNSFQKVENKGFCSAEIKTVDKHGDTADLTMTLHVKPLGINKREGKYRVDLAFIPTQKVYLESVLEFNEWNFLDSEINSENLQQFGSKTLNISPFIKMLGNLNYEINKPGFYNLTIYFEAKK